ncbi:MAG: hypothetical protein VX833_02440 [Actinomycetota bacterium]|nr:hypothetical protein [Actinomycetota bacterium]
MSDDDVVTLRLSSKSSFLDLPRAGLASLLRIHRIDPGGMAGLATSVQQAAAEILADEDVIEIDYQVTDTDIHVVLRSQGRTARISAPRG